MYGSNAGDRVRMMKIKGFLRKAAGGKQQGGGAGRDADYSRRY